MKKATGVIAAAVALLTMLPTSEVHAQTSNTIFPEGWDKSVRNRMFMRLGVISVNTKTNASDAVDLTGPVLTRQDVQNAMFYVDSNGLAPGGVLRVWDPDDELNPAKFTGIPRTNGGWMIALSALETIPEFTGPNATGLGTPPGIKAKVGEASTVALSLGYWLTADYNWMLEAFLLAKPLDVKVYGAGTNTSGGPNGLSGKHILSTKMLPPLAIVSRHFGAVGNRIRPFVGLGATYAVMYDAKSTDAYDTYVGGKTSVSIKNAFGVGPFVGLSGNVNDNWHVNVQLGQIKLKTEAILTTRNTIITTQSGVVNDFSTGLDGLTSAVETGVGIDADMVTKVMKLAARAKGQADMGTFSRKQKQDLRSTIVNVSVGYSF